MFFNSLLGIEGQVEPEKILSREKLKKEIDRLKAAGKKIVFTNGCFDILHVGHTRYLREARKLGDVLIVALNSDASVRAIKGEKRPLVPEAERAELLAALGAVDYVTIFDEETPLDLMTHLRPDFIVKGGDWAEDRVVGRDAVRTWGGRVAIIPEVKGFSTTNIVEKIKAKYA
jgi:D-beta-D-heptose 7-phosphate kinase/D-beta-D-heptose 1-phosphate adenosyltransferase